MFPMRVGKQRQNTKSADASRKSQNGWVCAIDAEASMRHNADLFRGRDCPGFEGVGIDGGGEAAAFGDLCIRRERLQVGA